jgi:hypothetical protein
MLGLVTAATPGTTVPPGDGVPLPTDTGGTGQSTIADVISSMWDNLGHDGYQTGFALIAATIAIVAMLNLKVHKAVLAPVAIGAFWAGWLTYNTFTARENPLFPGDVSAMKLWDVAFTSDTGFLLVVIVACLAAILLWRKGTALGGKVVLIIGAVLGASFLYNLVEAVRYS